MAYLQNADGDEALRVIAASSPPRVAHRANTTRFHASHARRAVQEFSGEEFSSGNTAGYRRDN